MKKIIIIYIFMLCVQVTYAQNDNVAKNNNLWFLQLTKFNINEKWGLENELHVRVANMGDDMQQLLIRPSVFYKASESTVFHVGYTHIESYSYGDQPLSIQTPENNFWVQATLSHGSLFGIGVSHRYRLEERWVGKINTLDATPSIDGSVHKNRFRYRLTLKKSIADSKFYVAAFNEIWLNFGENTALNRLDQNWLYTGIGYKINNSFAIETGYMKQAILKSDGIKKESNNTIQLTIHFSINRQ